MDFLNNTNQNKHTTKNSKIVLCNREILNLSGVTKMGNATENTISLFIANESMVIEGTNLHITKLDIETGVADIEGKVTAIKFAKAKNSQGFFKRIFQ